MTTEEPTVGTRFAGRYRVEALLGRGGMGAVFRVHDETLGEDVALKTLSLPSGRADDGLSRFRREVRLSRKVTHLNVARTFDLGEHDGVYYLTMQLVTGGDLTTVITDESPLAPTRAISLVLEMLGGLAAAHAAGVIHRDLKPANVLLDGDGHPVLTDFGIARAIEPSDATVKTGGLLGTPAYMAPEQVSGRPVDVRADLYAMGIILFELLTGRLPFDGDTPIATAVARLHQDALDPALFVTLPPGLGEIVLACLARDPNARPGSANEIIEKLRAVTMPEGADVATPKTRANMTGPTLMAPLSGTSTSTSASSSATRSRTTTRYAEQRLAILPFLYRGPPEHAYIADAIGDDLVDELARVRGLIVLSSGATRAFKDDRDPRRVKSELGADAVVDGSVQSDGKRIRISARLDDASTGTQLWNDRFEGGLEDVFALQDTMRRRIAESLRVGLTAATRRGDAPAEAVDLYLRARSRLRGILSSGSESALALLERALTLAPDFAPAVAAFATASIRAWFIPTTERGSGSEKQARDAVAHALEVADDLAETHHAAGTLHLHDGDVVNAVRELQAALAIAPTYTDSLETLGLIECEIGRSREGIARLHVVLDLSPDLVSTRMELARQAAFDGDHEKFEAILANLDHALERSMPIVQLRLREASYRRDLVEIERLVARGFVADPLGKSMMASFGNVALGRLSGADGVAAAESYFEHVPSPRFRSLLRQLLIEALLVAGENELAEQQLVVVASARLIDLTWLERCPLMSAISATAGFDAARTAVTARVRGAAT